MPIVTNGLPMHLVAGWIISGLWIDFGDVGLHVYNGVDANGLSAERAQSGDENAFTGETGHCTLRDGRRGT